MLNLGRGFPVEQVGAHLLAIDRLSAFDGMFFQLNEVISRDPVPLANSRVREADGFTDGNRAAKSGNELFNVCHVLDVSTADIWLARGDDHGE